MIEIPGIESELITRRIDFLRSRAMAHLELEPEDTHSKACAATLLRDAACLNFLVGQTGEACADLVSAGKHYLETGLVEGAPLVALGDSLIAQEILTRFSDVIERVRHQDNQRIGFEGSEQRGGMVNVGLGSAYEVLSLLQADLLLTKNNLQELASVPSPMEAVLERSGSYELSTTGMSIEKYSAVARWMVGEPRARSLYSSEFVIACLRVVYAVRADNIRFGMKDVYSWGMLLRPTELVDLDSLVLMYLALGHDHLERALEEVLVEESQLCQAPMIMARELMG